MVKSCISISSLYFIKTWCHISIRKSTQAQRENAIFLVELHNVSSKVCQAQQISFINFCIHLQNLYPETQNILCFGSTITVIEMLTLQDEE